MKSFIQILLVCSFSLVVLAKKYKRESGSETGFVLINPLSIGSLSFKANGQLYEADSAHARGYAVMQTLVAYINGANNENMVMNIEVKGVKANGIFLLNGKENKVDFTINHKTYSLPGNSDYLKVIINKVKQQGSFLLLNGLFEGQLQDKLGNKIFITEGKFSTYSL